MHEAKPCHSMQFLPLFLRVKLGNFLYMHHFHRKDSYDRALIFATHFIWREYRGSNLEQYWMRMPMWNKPYGASSEMGQRMVLLNVLGFAMHSIILTLHLYPYFVYSPAPIRGFRRYMEGLFGLRDVRGTTRGALSGVERRMGGG